MNSPGFRPVDFQRPRTSPRVQPARLEIPTTHAAPPEPVKSFFDPGFIMWLDDVVKKARAKYQEQRELEEQAAEQEALRRRLASKFCRDLFSWLENVELSFNTRFGRGVLAVTMTGAEGNRSLQLLARPLRSQERLMEIQHDESTCHLSCTTGTNEGAVTTQVVKLVLSEGIVLAETASHHYRPEELGQKIVEDLLQVAIPAASAR